MKNVFVSLQELFILAFFFFCWRLSKQIRPEKIQDGREAEVVASAKAAEFLFWAF